MNGLELSVCQRDSDQGREGACLIVNEPSQVAQQICHPFGRWRHESGGAWTGAADPVLGTP